jgi:hypothetical protein
MTVLGKAVVGTADGSPLPADLPIELQMVSVNQGVLQILSTTAQADGSFVFQNVPRLGPEVFYALSAVYDGLKQYSPPLSAEAMDEVGSIEFRLYETTDRVDGLQVVKGTMQIDFTDVRRVGLSILLELQVFNEGDRIVYAWQNLQGQLRPVSFYLELPVGAYGIAPEVQPDAQSQRFFIDTGTIPVVYDSLPIIPNWPTPHLIRLSFFLPYFDGAVIDQVFPVEVGNFAVWVPEDTIQVASDQFRRVEDVTTGEGKVYRVYEQDGRLAAAQNMIFTLEGIPTATIKEAAGDDSGGGSSLSGVLAVLALVFVMGAAIGGYWFWSARRKALGLISALEKSHPAPGEDHPMDRP